MLPLTITQTAKDRRFEVPSSKEEPETESPRMHLDFLDGLRGLAAVYVMLSHAALLLLSLHRTPQWGELFLRPFNFGHYAVAVFIVLSGFCLMLPVALSPNRHLRGGWREYLQRRGRRILPPYYAAFVLSLLAVPVVAYCRHKAGSTLEESGPVTGGNILAHLMLVHNWSNVYFQSIDGPLWSVATEWQIYFFLPFLLLPLWRRGGLLLTVAVASAIGLAPHFLLPAGRNLDWTCPWYLGLFALGMAGAVLVAGREVQPRQVFETAPWGLLTAAAGGLVGLGHILTQRVGDGASHWFMDILCGLFSACFLVWCSRRSQSKKPKDKKILAVAVLESRPAMVLGSMSYSIYLFHLPAEQSLGWLISSWHWSFGLTLLLIFGAVLPAVLGICYLFHLVFERPFMPGQPRSERSAEKAALTSPAP